MRTILAAFTASLLALPCAAQEKKKPPEKPPETAPAPATVPAPACGYIEKNKTTYQLHWLEREAPCVESKPVLKENKTDDVKCTLELDYNEHTAVRTEWVLKPCEVIKEVTICTQKPIVKKDPCTGCSVVEFEPVTETRQVKEITYQMVAQEKTVTIRTPFLKPVEKPITRKTLYLDYETAPVTRRERFGVLVPVEITERKPACCPPACAAPGTKPPAPEAPKAIEKP